MLHGGEGHGGGIAPGLMGDELHLQTFGVELDYLVSAAAG